MRSCSHIYARKVKVSTAPNASRYRESVEGKRSVRNVFFYSRSLKSPRRVCGKVLPTIFLPEGADLDMRKLQPAKFRQLGSIKKC